MFGALARRLFGSANDRYIKSLRPLVDQINELEPELEKLSDEALRARTAEFKTRLADGAELDDLLVEAFATVREAAKRTLGQRHFDVQLMGGIVLHRGMIAEMKTGEGKTLVATLPVYLNALAGKGVHVVTVNDYLAKRDAEWMGQIYRFLGMSVGCHRPRAGRLSAAGSLSLRRHLRHEQRTRLRLSARQHEIPAGGDGPPAVSLRDRRRGRFDPDRRGAHAADHFRPDRGQFRAVHPGRQGDPGARTRRLREGREAEDRHPDRDRPGEDGGAAARARAAAGRRPVRHP